MLMKMGRMVCWLSHAVGRRRASLGTPIPWTPIEPKTEANQPPYMTRGGVLGTPAKLQARPQGRGDEAAGSRRHGGKRASPTDPAPGAACGLGTLKASGGVKEGGDCFSEESAAVAEGTLKNQRQEGRQHSRSHKDTVLTRQWRCTSSASTAQRCHRCRSGTSSSSGAPRSPRRADQSVGHGGQHKV